MLATKDNTQERQMPEAETVSAEEAAKWFTRPGLAAALKVSVCTVDRMAANGEIPRVRVRRRVRFYLPDVVEALRRGDRKFGRAAVLPGNPKIETRNPMGEGNCREEAQEAQKL